MDKKTYILNAESNDYSINANKILEGLGEVDNCDLDYSSLKEQIRCKPYNVLVVRLRNYIGEEILNGCPSLRVVATATTGLNHIDVDKCRERDIKIISLKGENIFLRNIYATAEHTWALLLALIRKLPFAHLSVVSNQWDRYDYIGNELHGMTIGIIGFGRIGQMIAGYADSFGMKIITYTKEALSDHPFVSFVSLEELLEMSDVISIHLPFTNENSNFISMREFEKMKKRPFLINTSRGEIINEEDLLASLNKNFIKGAALDVLKGETQTNPTLNNGLVDYARIHNRLIITPHIGGATEESREKTEMFIANKIKEELKNAFGS